MKTRTYEFPGYRRNNALEKYMRETEAAAYIRVSAATLRRWRREKKINKHGTPPPRHCRRGRQIWYKLSDLNTWIESAGTCGCTRLFCQRGMSWD